MAATDLEYCLLGLIADGKHSGYDLRMILVNTPMRQFSSSPGSIYPALQRLEQRRWIIGDEDKAHPRRRRSFRITAIGRKALAKWLSTPVTADDVIYRWHELMLRLSFLHQLNDEAALAKFIENLRRELDVYTGSLKDYMRNSTSGFHPGSRLAVEAGIASGEALFEWSKRAQMTLRRGAVRVAKDRKHRTRNLESTK
jgi:DNA-binding PadR family transcriptional regulator